MTVNQKYTSILAGVAVVATLAALVVWLATHTDGQQKNEANTKAGYTFSRFTGCAAAQPRTSQSVDIDNECAIPVRIIGDPVPIPPGMGDVEAIPVRIIGERTFMRVVPMPQGAVN